MMFAAGADAQQFDRRARDEPEIVIAAGGRVGTCDVVQFTPDGNFLLAAGDDKVVHVWPHTEKGLDRTPNKDRTLRWRSWRDQLGGIKAVGVSPDGSKVAVGGYGLRISSIALIDRDSGATLAITWPKSGEGVSNFNAITAIAFHPDGNRIGFATADGTLWLWTPTKLAAPDPRDGRVWSAPARVGHLPGPRSTGGEEGLAFPKGIHFPDANTLVSVSSLGQVLACDLRGPLSDDLSKPIPVGKTLFNINEKDPPGYRITEVLWSGDGRWLAANTGGPIVQLWSADGKQNIPLRLPAEHFPRGLAIHPKTGAVAIGVGHAPPATPGKLRFYVEQDYEVWVYDNPMAGNNPEPLKRPHVGRVEALAFHPTENRLAIGGGDADEITLLDLNAIRTPISITRGAGRHLHGVNLSENGNIMGVRLGRNPKATNPNELGEGPWVRFDLTRFTLTSDANIKWVNPQAAANGWTIVPDASSRFIWYAERTRPDGGVDRLRLGLNTDTIVAPTCYTFVPTPADKLQRVLIGHYYGASLFELAPDRIVKNPQTGAAELPCSRLFVGHGAEVNSIVADKQGAWFVTASNDQTVAGWSLVDWPSQSALGASLEVKAGQLLVNRVDVGSPAYEAGLTSGDRIDLLAIDGRRFFDRREGKEPLATAEAAVEALKRPHSGVELVFGWFSPGQPGHRVTPTTLKQRPLWKWFPAFDERNQLTDSVVWMWHGSYYYTGSAHGDRMIGWHMNDSSVAGTPTYHPLERFKHLFLKPDAIAKLMATRSIEEALKEAQDGSPARRSFREFEPAPVVLALKQGTVRGEGIPVSIAVNPQGNNPDLLPSRVELWVNDYRIDAWPGRGQQNFQVETLIPAKAFRAGENQITVLALNPTRGRAEESRIVPNPTPAGKPELYGLAIGINDYSAHRKAVNGVRALGNLGKACADAESFQEEFLTYRGPGKCFPEGGMTLFLDAAANRKAILATFDQLKKSPPKPDDLLVVFFAGHGDLLTPKSKAPPPETATGVIGARGLPGDSGEFVFCCPNYVPTRAAVTALSSEELFEALAGVNCRKLVFLDACHAGGALDANVLRRFIPNGQGPIVIAACDRSEQSFEDEKLGHGVFTYAVLEAFGPQFRRANTNSDGRLSARELFEYVRDRVPELMRDVKPGNTQNPICFPQPDALPNIAIVTK
jgi:WD40 repeat protein/uncharacterized caspase-like protein